MIVDILFVTAVVVLLIFIFRIKFSKESVDKEVEEAVLAREREIQARVIRTQTINETQGATCQPDWQAEGENEEEQDEKEQKMDYRKQIRKKQKMREKQQRKQAHQQFLEQEQKRREQYEKKQLQLEQQEAEKERIKEQIVAQLQEEERVRREKEFNEWQSTFSVEESGQERQTREEEERQRLAFEKRLIGILKGDKLCHLQDLSHKFKLPTQEIIERIRQLQQRGEVAGVFDERGKYLSIEESEWNAVKQFIKGHGRIRKSLIKIPEKTDEDYLQLLESQQNQT